MSIVIESRKDLNFEQGIKTNVEVVDGSLQLKLLRKVDNDSFYVSSGDFISQVIDLGQYFKEIKYLNVRKDSKVTLNPDDKSPNIILNENKLTTTINNGAGQYIRAVEGVDSGKWYWEIICDRFTGANGLMAGIATKSGSGSSQETRGYTFYKGNKFPENTSFGSGMVAGDILGVALDMDAGELSFYKNGEFVGVSHTNLLPLGIVYPYITTTSIAAASSVTTTVNFGSTSFKYQVPVGYLPFTNVGVDIKIYTSTSPDNQYFNEFQEIDYVTGEIQSTQLRYLKIKIEIYGAIKEIKNIVNIFDFSEVDQFEVNEFIEFNSGLALKTNYNNLMERDESWDDEGNLYKKTIEKNNYIRIDVFEVSND